jgi:plasmid stabilization system protein ParE
MPRVFFTADARADLDDALGWYAMQAPEIAPQFQEALRVVVARISDKSQAISASPQRTRKALLRRFPYLMIFREERAAVYVVAVFHTSRNPRTWRNRSS